MDEPIDAAAVLKLIRDEGAIEAGDDFGPDDDLILAGLDSLGIMQLLLGIEERFGVVLEPGDLTRDHFATAGRLAELIATRRG